MNWTPWARIILRYGSGSMATWGLLSQEAARQIGNDPDVISIIATGLGIAVPAVTEGAYMLAKRKGWAT